jgi:hypothetical protein
MPVGMANVPVSFRNIINEIFKNMINLGNIAYMDDILIYTLTNEEYEKLFKEVLSHLQM